MNLMVWVASVLGWVAMEYDAKPDELFDPSPTSSSLWGIDAWFCE